VVDQGGVGGRPGGFHLLTLGVVAVREVDGRAGGTRVFWAARCWFVGVGRFGIRIGPGTLLAGYRGRSVGCLRHLCCH